MTASYPLTLLASTLALASALSAQVPGLPVLQNAFLNPGLGVAGNFGGGSGQSFYGAAAAWGLAGGRFQMSGAAGVQRANAATRGAYGTRLAANVWRTRAGSIAAGAFVGFGGAPRTESNNLVTNAATMAVPAGITVAYQRALGTRRGVAVYASPFYRWSRFDDGDVTTSGTVRISLGADFSISPSLGVSAGTEIGQSSSTRRTGAGLFGLAVTFVPGRR